MIRLADYFQHHGGALRHLLGRSRPSRPEESNTKPQAQAAHCTECDAILSPATYLRCRACRELICPTDLCRDSHFARHQAETVPAPVPVELPVRILSEPPLPENALGRCMVCKRALGKAQYHRCGLCDALLCKRGKQCLNLHFACHRVAARKATQAHAQAQLNLTPEEER